MPHVAERGRPAYGSRLLGPDRRRHRAAARGHARGALLGAPVLLLALRGLPRGLPGRDPASPFLLVRARAAVTTPEKREAGLGFRVWSLAWRSPAAYRASVVAGRLGLRLFARRGWASSLPGPGRRWTFPTRRPEPLASALIPDMLAALERRRASGERVLPAGAGAAAATRAVEWGCERAVIADDPWLDALGVTEALSGAGLEVVRFPPGAAGPSSSGWRGRRGRAA